MKIQLTVVFVAVIALAAPAQQAKNYAPEAFRKLQVLAGDWEGKDDQGSVVRTNFKAMISNTVVMETLNAAGMEEMLTLYSQDGNGVALLHYCPTNNQPHMRAVPASADAKQLSFAFIDAGNLPSIAVGHEHKMVLDFEDKDHSPSIGRGARTEEIWRWSTIWPGSRSRLSVCRANARNSGKTRRTPTTDRVA